MNTSDMSYYDFDKVDLEIARRVEKEGIKALLDDDSCLLYTSDAADE